MEMLFDDEDPIELDNFKSPPKCVAVPLKAFISLKDLWVPSELLPNRNRVIVGNRNKSLIFHTLERKYVESLSVYIEDSKDHLDNRVLSIPSACTSINNQNDTSSSLDKPNTLEVYHSENSNEQLNITENQLDIDRQITNFFNDDEHVNIRENPLDIDMQITNFFGVNSRGKQCEVPFSECVNNYETEPSIICEKSENDNDEKFGYLLDLINNEESLCSDSFVNFSNETSIEVLDITEHIEKEECDNCVQSLNLLQKENTELSEVGLPEKNEIEPVLELPIAYKRPTLEEPKKKLRNQKEKKKKGGVKKKLQLGDFLQAANPDGYEDLPKRDEFYDNLVQRGLCQPSKVVESEFDYPTFKSEGIEFIGTSKNPNLNEESLSLHHNSDSGNLFEPSVLKGTELKPSVLKGTELKDLASDPVASNPVDGELTTTLVLENICKGITKENIESLVSGYGEVKELSIKPDGKFIKVKAKLVLDCADVDWLIECLNETEPFGASGGTVKCCKL